jgi:hypothetical protein
VLQIRLAFLHSAKLGGQVYAETARRLTSEQKAAIWARDRGLCVQCGRPGAEVDHIDGSSDDPSNLQLLCADCHHAKTRQALAVITDPVARLRIREMHRELAERIDSPTPTRACDNEQTWARAWRSWPTVTAQAKTYTRGVATLGFADIIAVVAATSHADG